MAAYRPCRPAGRLARRLAPAVLIELPNVSHGVRALLTRGREPEERTRGGKGGDSLSCGREPPQAPTQESESLRVRRAHPRAQKHRIAVGGIAQSEKTRGRQNRALQGAEGGERRERERERERKRERESSRSALGEGRRGNGGGRRAAGGGRATTSDSEGGIGGGPPYLESPSPGGGPDSFVQLTGRAGGVGRQAHRHAAAGTAQSPWHGQQGRSSDHRRNSPPRHIVRVPSGRAHQVHRASTGQCPLPWAFAFGLAHRPIPRATGIRQNLTPRATGIRPKKN